MNAAACATEKIIQRADDHPSLRVVLSDDRVIIGVCEWDVQAAIQCRAGTRALINELTIHGALFKHTLQIGSHRVVKIAQKRKRLLILKPTTLANLNKTIHALNGRAIRLQMIHQRTGNKIAVCGAVGVFHISACEHRRKIPLTHSANIDLTDDLI